MQELFAKIIEPYFKIALKDENSNYTFQQKKDKIGFKKNFITLPTDSSFIIKMFKETNNFKKCVFISFKEKNIYDLLKIKKAAYVGLSFSSNISVKIIIKK